MVGAGESGRAIETGGGDCLVASETMRESNEVALTGMGVVGARQGLELRRSKEGGEGEDGVTGVGLNMANRLSPNI